MWWGGEGTYLGGTACAKALGAAPWQSRTRHHPQKAQMSEG